MLIVEQTDKEEQTSSNNIDEKLECSQWQMSDALALARHGYKLDQSAHGQCTSDSLSARLETGAISGRSE
jgi:hypothetical protein